VKILVSAKRVPDPEQKVKLKGNTLDQSAVNWQLNQFDEYAVETALRLTEAGAGGARSTGAGADEVIVASIGPKEVQQQLRSTLAMGADRAILVAGADESLDAEIVARTFQKLAEQEKPDLILMGKLAADSESNDVGQRLAGILGWPQATFACSIEITDGGKALLVGREVDAGVEVKKVMLPAVVTVDLRIVAPEAVKSGKGGTAAYPEGPRYASLKGIMAAKKKPIVDTTLATLGVTAEQRVKVVGIEAPPARKAGIKVSSVEELVQKLHNEAKVI
jgi:electron transfer flavoprotein beta subunit